MHKRRLLKPGSYGRPSHKVPSDAENRRRLKAATAASAATLGEILGAFLIRAGMSRDDVSDVFHALAQATLRRELQLEPEPPPDWSQVSDAVTHWWRNPLYLDENGRPRQLPERGPAPSIEHLLNLTVDPDLHERAKELLRQSGVAVRRGRWHFEDDHAQFALTVDQAIDRLKIAMSGMFANALENLVRRRLPTSSKNIDRTALVASYPVELIPELRAHLRQRLQLMLEDADGWLTNMARQRSGGPVALVGVTAFVHTGSQRTRREASAVPDEKARRASKPRARQRRAKK
jgi:hypothetical protein